MQTMNYEPPCIVYHQNVNNLNQGSSLVKAMEAFTEVTKLVKAFGFDVIRFGRWEDCRRISVSKMLIRMV